MNVREVIAALQEMDPEAEVRFFHLRKVMKDGSGRVESYPVMDVVEGDGEVTLSDFICEGGACLYKVRRAEWEQPALKSREAADDDEEDWGESIPEPTTVVRPVDTLLVNPPFTKGEWSAINVWDIGQEGSPLGRRLMEYLRHYHRAVMGSNRLHELMAAAGLPSRSDEPFDEQHLQRVLKRFAGRQDSTVHGMEVMMATVEFAGCLNDVRAVTLGPETLEWLQKVETLVVLTLVVCVNRHFGLIR